MRKAGSRRPRVKRIDGDGELESLRGRINPVLACFAQGFLDISGAGFGFFRPLATGFIGLHKGGMALKRAGD
jgi:hypothetical protein